MFEIPNFFPIYENEAILVLTPNYFPIFLPTENSSIIKAKYILSEIHYLQIV